MNNPSQLEQEIKQQQQDHHIVLYMKGVPEQPQCGFSASAVQLLQACGADFFYVNILDRLDIRQALPKLSNWPTFPQLYIDGELIGGSDIMIELFQNGELRQLIGDKCQ